jgi:hypothetical protein
MSIATLFEDRKTPGQFRVEAEDEDGGMEVAIFAGPNALDRAIIFAGGGAYYTEWSDPHALAGY